jgi:orotidine-5'-phosphate decarboxylase
VDSVVTSPLEVGRTRKAGGAGVPARVQGVRHARTDVNDHNRLATPAEAIRAGATWVDVHRAITQTPNPAAAAAGIAPKIAEALRTTTTSC